MLSNKIPRPTLFQRFSKFIFRNVSTEERFINQSGGVYPPTSINNRTDNTRYNFFTFIPVIFFNQFKHFLNMFFLVMALSQFYPPLRIGLVLPQVFPVFVILAIAYIKEFFDEMQRRKKDRLYNEELFMFCY